MLKFGIELVLKDASEAFILRFVLKEQTGSQYVCKVTSDELRCPQRSQEKVCLVGRELSHLSA